MPFAGSVRRSLLTCIGCIGLIVALHAHPLATIDGQAIVNRTNVPPPDSVVVRETVTRFLKTFTDLDYPSFINYFAPYATAFFPPSARFPYRANNREEIGAVFRKVFDHFRSLRTAPPYLSIEPIDLRIQMLGDCAIVTFTLNDPDMLGRRTVVLQKQEDNWLIVHLHASGVPSSSATP